ncbi:hypothetical protein HF086_003297 [Spodoptera exigua]|uniref:Uncharacterized protein n=1 Tax=Spodoptera exigua TaxID=7107 RepID=A0A922MY21_SPOEX|nr:hypothetical protein HF086_003297 [Spodoptera exigua]
MSVDFLGGQFLPRTWVLKKLLKNKVTYYRRAHSVDIVGQIGADGRRSQIFLAMSTAAEFRDHLSSFSDFYSSLGPPNPDNVPDDGKLKSEMMLKVSQPV